MISAKDYGALGDDSGRRVSEWLSGTVPPPADLAEATTIEDLRARTGLADLQLTDTIDWAAIMWAAGVAGERPVFLPCGRYRMARSLRFERGGLEGEVVSAGSPQFRTHVLFVAGAASSDLIHIHAPASNRHFHFRNFSAQGGRRTFYGSAGGDGTVNLEQHSVFENLYFTSSVEEGFFFDGLQATGCTFRKIKCESSGTHGMRFRGPAMLNGAQILYCRMVRCGGNGFFLENTHAQAATPGLIVSGTIAEYNKRCGMVIQGMQGTLISPYFESNNDDAVGEEPDLRLASSVSGSPTVHANVTAIGAAFANPKNPSGVRISGTAPHKQRLTLINPAIFGGTVKDDNLTLTIVPSTGVATVV